MIIINQGEEGNVILADPDEEKVVEKLNAAGCNVILSPQLEAMTGADFVVTPLDMPFVPALLQKHIEAGAFLIQRKSGHDLSASVTDRMPASLARMRVLGARQAQCVLLFIGVMMSDANGEAIIDGRPVVGFNGNSYWIIQSAIEKWSERGGVYTNLSRVGLLADWLILKERHIREFKHEPVHTVYDPTDALYEIKKNDPLQELVLVKDWRKTLMSLPGIGQKKIDALINHVANNHNMVPPNLIDCMVYLTTWSMVKEVPGFGKGIYKQMRDWFGIADGFNIGLDVDLEEED